MAAFLQNYGIASIFANLENFELSPILYRYSQILTVLYRALLCVNQWEEDKYFSLFRY
jgi:hypothetical protein